MDQGFYDFAVSRAYYAMFYAAQTLLLKDNLSFSKHSATISAFGKHFAKSGRVPVEYHRYLIEAQTSRNIGDYDIHSDLTADDASVHIDRAQQFIQHATKFLSQSATL